MNGDEKVKLAVMQRDLKYIKESNDESRKDIKCLFKKINLKLDNLDKGLEEQNINFAIANEKLKNHIEQPHGGRSPVIRWLIKIFGG